MTEDLCRNDKSVRTSNWSISKILKGVQTTEPPSNHPKKQGKSKKTKTRCPVFWFCFSFPPTAPPPSVGFRPVSLQHLGLHPRIREAQRRQGGREALAEPTRPKCSFIETSYRKFCRNLAKYPPNSGVSYRISCSWFLRFLGYVGFVLFV